jgi:N-formylglutamate amidohydrolase
MPVSILIRFFLKIKDNVKASSQIKFPMPVLFTCPHGGVARVTPLRNRDNLPHSCKRSQFKDQSDLHTIGLTESIAINILRLGGREVYRNIALVHRSFVDFNRDPECAFEPSKDDLGKLIYNEYHDGILGTIKKMYIQNKQGLRFLFDFHGTIKTQADIFFGTDDRNPDGSTICGLLKLNPKALWDNDTGLIKLLQDKGYRTYPRVINQHELPELDGGTTVKNYGGCNVKRRVEAIQCEVGAELRNPKKARSEKFARDMAECILTFVKPYISES